MFDPWAVSNLATLSRGLAGVLDAEQRRHVNAALTQFAPIDRTVLLAVLIHGELTKGNVLIPEPSPIHRRAGAAAVPPSPVGAGVVIVDFAVANRLFFFLVVPLIGFNIGQVLALGISTVRFGRRPQRSATSLAVVACVVAWIRLFLGPPAPIPEEFGIYLQLQLANWIVSIGCVVTVALIVRASRPMATRSSGTSSK